MQVIAGVFNNLCELCMEGDAQLQRHVPADVHDKTMNEHLKAPIFLITIDQGFLLLQAGQLGSGAEGRGRYLRLWIHEVLAAC
jgi:hypothetical protein